LITSLDTVYYSQIDQAASPALGATPFIGSDQILKA